MATASSTFLGTKCQTPKHALDNRTPTATGVRARTGDGPRSLFRYAGPCPRLWRFFACAGSLAMAQEGGFLQGKATDSSGAPIYGALVLVEGANGSRYTTVTDDKGLFRISSLAFGKLPRQNLDKRFFGMDYIECRCLGNSGIGTATGGLAGCATSNGGHRGRAAGRSSSGTDQPRD